MGGWRKDGGSNPQPFPLNPSPLTISLCPPYPSASRHVRVSLPVAALATIRRHGLLKAGDRVLVAVSGGADSVALLHVLQAMARRERWTLAVAHLHHGIRGRTADADATFVRGLARRLGLRCVTGRAQVPALARRRGLSLEMAAREARYTFLAKAAKRLGAAVVVTAHTADDQAETVLLRLVRGAGPAGLAGIPYAVTRRGLRVVRPLLDAGRPEVLAYLRARRLAWREDETNLDRSIPRNRVRHDLLPLLEREFNPRVREALGRASRLIGDDNAFLDRVAEGLRRAFGKGYGADALDLEQARACVPALRRRVLRLWLRGAGVPEEALSFETIERVSAYVEQAARRGALVLEAGWRVVADRHVVRIAAPVRLAPPVVPVRLKVPGVTRLPALGVRITARLAPGVVRERGGRPGEWPARASLDASVWKRRALYVRPVRAGDRLQPYGMAGTRKVHDILIDAKVPRDARPRIPVIECGGELVWLPGYRIARTWAVGKPGSMALQLTVRALFCIEAADPRL